MITTNTKNISACVPLYEAIVNIYVDMTYKQRKHKDFIIQKKS